MKAKKPRKQDPLRTEAAIKRAVKIWAASNVKFGKWCHLTTVADEPYCVAIGDSTGRLAIADLRDLYRKRQPLKGITKAMRKMVQPKRGRGK